LPKPTDNKVIIIIFLFDIFFKVDIFIK
jgi:hypothetical protein